MARQTWQGGVLAAVFALSAVSAEAQKQSPLGFTISEKTTRITAPLTGDGRVDYLAHMNQKLSRGVTAQNNQVVGLLLLLGRNWAPPKLLPDYCRALGVDPSTVGSGLAEAPEAIARKLDEVRKGPWSPERHPELSRFLDQQQEALAELVRLSRRRRYYSPMLPAADEKGPPMVLATLPQIAGLRYPARLLAARAMRSVQQGEYADALADIQAIYDLSTPMADQSPTLIERLVGIALRRTAIETAVAFVSYDNLPLQQGRAAAEMLAGWKPLPSISETYEGFERYALLDTIQWLALQAKSRQRVDIVPDSMNRNQGGHPLQMSVPTDLMDWDLFFARANKGYDRVVESLRAPTPEARNQLGDQLARSKEQIVTWATTQSRKIDLTGTPRFPEGMSQDKKRRLASSIASGVLVGGVFLPVGIHRAVDIIEEANMHLELARVAAALRQHRLNKGKFPDNLAALQPDLLKEIPTDVFSSRPVRYQILGRGRGYRLYSVGRDMTDDGGDAEKDVVIQVTE
jgi:hypothetical protein